MWTQMARYYGPMMLPVTVAVVMLVISMQMKEMAAEGKCPTFLQVKPLMLEYATYMR
jgi:hypothetical protein